jgi:hypothetical protein
MINYLALIKTPRKFFQSVREEPLSTTIKRVSAPILILGIITSFLSVRLLDGLYEIMNQPAPGLLSSVITTIVAIPLSMLIFAGMLQLSFRLLKVKARISSTLKALLYPTIFAFAITILADLITYITPIVIARLIIYMIINFAVGIWLMVLTAVGLSELNEIHTSKAIWAYFLSMLLLFGIIFVLTVIAVLAASFILK